MSLFEELKRRNVFRVTVAYIVASWVLLQVADLVLDAIKAPDWVIQAMLMFVVLGFIATVIIAWAYEMTPEGIKRESEVERDDSITHKTAAKLDRITIGLLVAVVAIMLVERFVLTAPEPAAPQQVQATEPVEKSTPGEMQQATAENSIAVLPFVAMSSGDDDVYFADGLTEEILNSLAQLPELLITARTSSFSFKGQDIPVTDIAEKLGVAHIVEGSVRRSGDRLRVTAQLVRAVDGFHLWSENYDSTSGDTIQVQEDIAEKIALAMDVVMDDNKRELMKQAGLRDVEAFIAMQKARKLYGEAHGDVDQIEYLREANKLYELVLERVPGYPKAHLEHSDLYMHILLNENNGLPSSATEEDIASAMQLATADMTAAVEGARNFSQENNAQIDLAFLSGNWRGISGRIQRFVDDSGCDNPSWSPGFALPFGFAEQYAVRAAEIVACDPMRSSRWFDESRAHMWAGDMQKALAVAERGMEVAPGGWLKHALLWALAAHQRFEDVDHVIDTHMRIQEDVEISRMAKYAAMGDMENFQTWFVKFQENESPNHFWKGIVLAWTGQREAANEVAVKMDENVFGAQALLLTTYWCMCGAPFDLEATPNFAAKLEESGLPWPPPSPIKWPLKDW